MMQRTIDSEISGLKDQLVAMAALVEYSLATAEKLLLTGNAQLKSELEKTENEINRWHKRLDESCLRLLALQQPLASDLRVIVSVIKMNNDLERMGDQSMNVSQNAVRYLNDQSLTALDDFAQMFTLVRKMIRDVIDSFVRSDVEQARAILRADDQVDALKYQVFKKVLELLKADSKWVEQGLTLILIARNLERVGDHATNIAEDVIFAVTGEDVRHTPRVEAMGAIRSMGATS